MFLHEFFLYEFFILYFFIYVYFLYIFPPSQRELYPHSANHYASFRGSMASKKGLQITALYDYISFNEHADFKCTLATRV